MNKSKFAQILQLALPIALALIPGGPALAPYIQKGFTEAEGLTHPEGTTAAEKSAAKKKHYEAIVLAGVQATNSELALANKPLLPVPEVMAAASAAADTTIGIINIVHGAAPGETLPGAVSGEAVALGATSAQGDGSGD